MHPILFGLGRCGKSKAGRRSARLRMPPRKLALAWLFRIVGHSRRSRLTERNGTPQLLDQKKFLTGLDRTDGPRDDRSELENAAQVVVFRAEPLRKRNGWPARAERYRVRKCEAAIRAEWFGDAASGPMRT